MLKKILCLILSLALAACAAAPPASSAAEDAAVYTAALKVEFKIDSLDGLVISSSSHINGFDSSGDYLRENFGVANNELVDNFLQANQESIALDPALKLLPGVILLSPDEIDQVLNTGLVQNRWKAFYERYPKTVGVVQVSQVGYNRAHTSAMVAVGAMAGFLAGHGEYLLLEKVNGSWQVTKNLMAWIS